MFTREALSAAIKSPISTRFYDSLVHTMLKYNISTEPRINHFMAQILHESAGFRYRRELWGPTPDQRKYEPPSNSAKRLGNTTEGDGYKFRGRGYMQLTGRYNYTKYGEYCNVDFITNPDLVEGLPYSLDVAGWFWHTKNINPIADGGDIIAVTKRINGGINGLSDRINWFNAIKTIMYV